MRELRRHEESPEDTFQLLLKGNETKKVFLPFSFCAMHKTRIELYLFQKSNCTSYKAPKLRFRDTITGQCIKNVAMVQTVAIKFAPLAG